MIQFGKYDRKISFISFLDVDDGYSGSYPLPVSVLDTLSNVKQLRGSNSLESAQLELPKTYVFKVQYRLGFEPTQEMQILYQGITHVIKGVEVYKERNTREWIITAIRTDNEVTALTVQNTLDSSLDFIL